MKPRMNQDLLKKGGVHSEDRKDSKKAKRAKDKQKLKDEVKGI